MFCTKCGTKVENGKFCPNCGAEVGGSPTVNTVSAPAPKKKSHVGLILGIVFGVLFLLAILFVVVFFLLIRSVSTTATGTVTSDNKHLVCTASEGNITLDYNEDEIYGYDAEQMSYNLEEQQKLFEQVGADVYMDTFNTWFETHTSGSCVIKDDSGKVLKDYSKGKTNTNNNTKTNNGTDTTKTKVVGEPIYGYIEVPTSWVNFKDVNGGHQIQFSYVTKYIVTLDYVDPNQNGTTLTAKDLALNFLAKSKEDSNLEGVTGATVTIGKDKKYTAYQVYMYYKEEATYLITYWFDGDDGYIHYVALEGPEGVEDLLSIPESFSLTK